TKVHDGKPQGTRLRGLTADETNRHSLLSVMIPVSYSSAPYLFFVFVLLRVPSCTPQGGIEMNPSW
ncbi:MAG: hypothetical protein ACREVW_08100, partial [Burkholderiales bacterium]